MLCLEHAFGMGVISTLRGTNICSWGRGRTIYYFKIQHRYRSSVYIISVELIFWRRGGVQVIKSRRKRDNKDKRLRNTILELGTEIGVKF